MAAEYLAAMGRRIKEHRYNQGFTQEEVARLMGGTTTAAMVSRWERGANRPTDENLEKLARALHVPVAHLLADEPETPQEPTLRGPLDLAPSAILRRIEASMNTLDQRLARVELAQQSRAHERPVFDELATRLAEVRRRAIRVAARGGPLSTDLDELLAATSQALALLSEPETVESVLDDPATRFADRVRDEAARTRAHPGSAPEDHRDAGALDADA